MNRTSLLERPLEDGALRKIERSLRAKLKAHRLSDSFIERCGEEAIQRAWFDYLRSRASGTEIDNPAAFIANAAFCRAIDELRHEAHQNSGIGMESLLASERFAAPAAEEVAVEHLAADELHQALEALPAEERRVLALHYFEQLSDRRASQALYCSESTFRRRRQRALRRLAARLGAPAPEPGSDLAIETGLAAWVSLRGADVALAHGLLSRIAEALERSREAVAWLSVRLREQAARLSGGGGGEGIGAIAGGPLGKMAGGCAGAAAACLLGGAIGAGVSGMGPALTGHDHSPPARLAQPARIPSVAAPTAPAAPAPPAASSAAASSHAAVRTRPAPSAAERRRRARRAEERQVEEQASAIARVEAESTPSTGEASAASTPQAEAVTVAPSGSQSSSSGGEEAQVRRQFGGFR